MSKLPVFALPETVVFPGMTLPLYIFEERYKRMVKDCAAHNQRRIIITLGKSGGNPSDSEARFHEIGAFVDILAITENPDHTYHVVTHGQGRCRIEVVERRAIAELSGEVRYLPYSAEHPYPLERQDPNLERVAAWDCLDTFRDYARRFFAAAAFDKIDEALPEDLVYQASFVCANLRVPAPSKQAMLEAPSLVGRFELARKLMLELLAEAKANSGA